jgi:putative acyl-CoA dehydrogenase
VLQKVPEGVEAWQTEVALAGDDRLADAATEVLKVIADLADPPDAEYSARWITARMAVLLQASLLLRHSTDEVAEAFVNSRVLGAEAGVFGTLPRGIDTAAIVERAMPRS